MVSPGLRFRLFLLLCLALPSGFAQAAPQLYSIGEPTADEQLYLELINRARANPAGEGLRLAATSDPDVLNALDYWKVDLGLFQLQMQALPAAPPLAFNAKLLASARPHSADMLTHAYQDHTGSDGSTPGMRMSAQGYASSSWAENVYAYEESVEYGQAAFEVDWGGTVADGGMQVPPGHRLNIHNGAFREIGVGVIDGSNGDVGPHLVTEDFAIPVLVAPSLLTGVVFRDANGNGFYDVGEGIGGVNVAVAGAEFYAITSSSGGYTVPLPNDGNYTVTFSGGGLATVVKTAVAALGANVKVDYVAAETLPPAPPRLANISTRLPVGTGDNALIGGFIVTGMTSKQVLLRGLGPSLSATGVPLTGMLQNPTLELRDSAGNLLASNDNWQENANVAAIRATGIAPAFPAEAALLVTLPANDIAYIAILHGAGDTTGLGLVEIYDLAPTADSQLANISTRGLVQTGDNVLIGGLIVTGAEAHVIVRALGPSLGVAGRLPDPTLELFDADGFSLGSNDSWESDQPDEIKATQLAPTDSAEAALVRTLAPGGYTVVVRGANGQSGVAVVEAYNVP